MIIRTENKQAYHSAFEAALTDTEALQDVEIVLYRKTGITHTTVYSEREAIQLAMSREPHAKDKRRAAIIKSVKKNRLRASNALKRMAIKTVES